MRRVRVLLDANVLVDAQVRDLFLRLAEADLIDVRWSAHILVETRRALIERIGLQAAASDRLLDTMRHAFPLAGITGYEHLIDDLELPDADDRHVLAAAMHDECDLLVTDNTRDFPHKTVDDADLLVLDVDEALALLVDSHPDRITDVVTAQIAALRRPTSTVEAFVDRLATRAPYAAMRIGAILDVEKYKRMLVDQDNVQALRDP